MIDEKSFQVLPDIDPVDLELGSGRQRDSRRPAGDLGLLRAHPLLRGGVLGADSVGILAAQRVVSMNGKRRSAPFRTSRSGGPNMHCVPSNENIIRTFVARESRRGRFVPLHEHLIEQGFLEFAHGHRRDQRLFAADFDSEKTTAAQATAGKLAEWVRKVVKDPNVAPNHGWRHRFETEARFHMAEMFIDAIQGHAGKTQGGKHGRFPPRMLGPLIAKMPRQPVQILALSQTSNREDTTAV